VIQKIHISNYKSVVDLTLDLGQVNVFIGENGCGKTNILEAIALGGAAAANKLDNEFLFTRGIRMVELSLLKPAFEIEKTKKQIEIRFKNIKNEQLDAEIENFDILSIKEYNSQGELAVTRSSLLHQKKGKKGFTDYGLLNNFLIYCPENYFLRNFQDEGQIRPLGIRGEGLFKHILELYRQKPETLETISENLKLIDWFQGFDIPKDLFFTEKRLNIKDRFLENLSYFDQRSANEGFLYLLFYFTLFVSEFTPKFFAIDNIDNALNPKLCAKLIQVLVKLSKEHGKQTILTTHNPAILDGLDLADDQQRLFTIYRNADGHTVARRIMPLKKVKGVESIRLSEAYIRGYLGGLPENF